MLTRQIHNFILRFGPNQKITVRSGISTTQLSVFFLSHDCTPFHRVSSFCFYVLDDHDIKRIRRRKERRLKGIASAGALIICIKVQGSRSQERQLRFFSFLKPVLIYPELHGLSNLRQSFPTGIGEGLRPSHPPWGGGVPSPVFPPEPWRGG